MSEAPDFAKDLRVQARRAIVVAHQYRLDYHGASTEAIFLFFEGLDDKKYYMPLVQRYKGVEITHPYICDGKRGVIEAWTVLEKWQIMDMDRVLFFVDMDHDVYLQMHAFLRPNIFTTSTYSFENYLVSAEAVQVVLSQYTPVSRSERRFKRILAEFESAYNAFVACMRPIMAWCIQVRAQGEKPNLGNVNLRRIVKVEAGGRVAKRHRAFRNFRNASGVNANVVSYEYRMQIRRLREEPAKRWLRGKYELWFLQEYLDRVFSNLISENRKVAGARRIRRPRALEGADLVELLSGRVSYPGELTEFLKSHALG